MKEHSQPQPKRHGAAAHMSAQSQRWGQDQGRFVQATGDAQILEHLLCHSGTLSWPAQGLWAQKGQEEYFCVPVGGPWLQGRPGSMKKVLEGSLPACEKLLRSDGTLLMWSPANVFASLGWCWCTPGSPGGKWKLSGFGKLHQPQGRTNQPFSLVGSLQSPL